MLIFYSGFLFVYTLIYLNNCFTACAWVAFGAAILSRSFPRARTNCWNGWTCVCHKFLSYKLSILHTSVAPSSVLKVTCRPVTRHIQVFLSPITSTYTIAYNCTSTPVKQRSMYISRASELLNFFIMGESEPDIWLKNYHTRVRRLPPASDGDPMEALVFERQAKLIPATYRRQFRTSSWWRTSHGP